MEDDYDDVTLVLGVLSDIRRNVARIADALTDGGDAEETEATSRTPDEQRRYDDLTRALERRVERGFAELDRRAGETS